MSRIGKQPVLVPGGVKVAVAGNVDRGRRPLGKLELELPPGRRRQVRRGGEAIVRQPRRATPGRPGPCTA